MACIFSTARSRVASSIHASGWPLLPIGDSRFFSPTDYGTIVVIFDDAGYASRIDWYRGPEPSSYERRPE